MSKSDKNKSDNRNYQSYITKEIHNEKFNPPVDISVKYASCNPESCEEQINCYGTHNIQPTANTDNDFPAIAQGATPEMENRTQEFFRDGDDFNPASDMSPDDCF